MAKRKICVVNGKRGGFNALLPTMLKIAKDPTTELQVVLTDMHLSGLFGRTIKDAERWIKVSATVDMKQKSSASHDRVDALGRGLSGFGKVFQKLSPDIILLLGDRSETLAAAFAALQLKIPIAHIQGGEISGNIDGIQRHAITKLSHIHFTETKEAKRRVLELGEEPWRVHFTGAPYIDFIKSKLYTPKDEVRKKYGLEPDEKFLLLLQHPVTTEPEKSYAHMKKILKASELVDLKRIVVYPCSDQGYQGIIDAIEEERDKKNIFIYRNIPAEDFIGLEVIAGALVGNSSAGIYEAPYVFCPAVNVGRRQEGREREINMIDVLPDSRKILAGINKALYDEKFKKNLTKLKFLYGDGKAFLRIVKVLKTVQLGERLFEKKLTF